MNILIQLFFGSFFVGSLNAGIASDTIIYTQEGSTPISCVKVGDRILSLDKNFLPQEKTVEYIREIEARAIIEIITEDDVVLRVIARQKLCANDGEWKQANHLTVGDVLFKRDTTHIGIKSIRYKKEPTKICFIVVKDDHTFFAAENGVLLHNGPYTGYLVYCGTKTALYAALVGTVAGSAIVSAGAATTGTIAIAGGTSAMSGAGVAVVLGTTAGGVIASASGATATSLAVGATTVALAGASAEVGIVVGGVITGVAAAETVATSAAVYGLAATTAAVIEAASIAASAPFFASPWLP